MNPVGWVGVELQLVTEQPPRFGHQAPKLSFFSSTFSMNYGKCTGNWDE